MCAATRYFRAMAILIPTLTLVAAALAVAAPGDSAVQRSPTVRAEGGASVAFTVSARIISASARVGAALGPPEPRMVARRTTVSAADGRAVPALVYDFE